MYNRNEICKKYDECIKDFIITFNARRNEMTNRKQIEQVIKNPVTADKLFNGNKYDKRRFNNMSNFINKLQEAMASEKNKEMKSIFRRLFWTYHSMIMPIVTGKLRVYTGLSETVKLCQ